MVAMVALQIGRETHHQGSAVQFEFEDARPHPDVIQRGELLPSAVGILKTADRAFCNDQPEVRRCIAEATTLLLTALALSSAETSDAATAPRRGGLAPWQLRRVTEFVSANIARPIRIDDLAAITRFSTSYFFRAFRHSTGESPHAYVIRRKMEHAKALMLVTDSPLSQIALDCGFADQAHLTRTFRQMVGVTPACWRRLRRVGPSA